MEYILDMLKRRKLTNLFIGAKRAEDTSVFILTDVGDNLVDAAGAVGLLHQTAMDMIRSFGRPDPVDMEKDINEEDDE